MHTSPKWTHMSIGPSNQSEEARPSVTIDRRQTKGNTREKAVKASLHLHRNLRPHRINSQTLSLQEWSQTPTQGTHNTPRNEQLHIPHTGEFHPSLHSPFYPFHLRDLSTGAFVQTEVQIQKQTRKNNPHLFPLHHSHIGPTPSQTHRDHFLIRKNPEPFSYRHISISRYHFIYTTI